MNLAFLGQHFLFPLPQWLKKHLQFVFSRYTPLHSHIHPYLQITGHIFSNQPHFLSFPDYLFLLLSRLVTHHMVFLHQLQLLAQYLSSPPPTSVVPQANLAPPHMYPTSPPQDEPSGHWGDLETLHGHYPNNFKLFTPSRLSKHLVQQGSD